MEIDRESRALPIDGYARVLERAGCSSRTKTAGFRCTGMKALSKQQHAKAEITIGQGLRVSASVTLTPVGIVAVTVLVMGILLATRALVTAIIHESR